MLPKQKNVPKHKSV